MRVVRLAVLVALAVVLLSTGSLTAQAPAPELLEFRAIYQELIESTEEFAAAIEHWLEQNVDH